jgi:flagellar protein FliL
MSNTPSAAAATTPAAPAKKKLPLILAAVALVAGGGGGLYWWMAQAAPVHAEAPAAPSLHDRGLVTFEPFVVNLADAGGSRFLRVTVRLVVASAERAKEVEESPVVLMGARSAILDLLTTQSAEALVTPEGKAALRASIKERVSHDGELEVVDVLFSDFVVQF